MRLQAEQNVMAGSCCTTVTAPPPALAPSPTVLVDLLSLLSTAETRTEVAEAACLALGNVAGVRTVAFVRRGVADAVFVACSGYASDLLPVGTRIPLASAFPAAEAIRTGRPAAQPGGRGWFALPLEPQERPMGALLLGLSVAPPAEPDAIVVLDCVATALSAAYRCVDAAERQRVRSPF
jgi:hypothetical protein